MSSRPADLEISFEVPSQGTVSAILNRPEDARYIYVLAHGAGAGMRHPFMESMAYALGSIGIATFRYQFPYMESGKRAPNRRPVLTKTVRCAVSAASASAPNLNMIAGGKSMGGRMTSLAASEAPLPGVRGLVFLGFPLHAAGKPSADRGEHLERVDLPMLFIQGTRDRLADLSLLRPLLENVKPASSLHIVDDGDHSFKVPKRAGLTQDEVIRSIAQTIGDWTARL